jgi:hypothetical protein
MECHVCHSLVPEGSGRCPFCGAVLPSASDYSAPAEAIPREIPAISQFGAVGGEAAGPGAQRYSPQSGPVLPSLKPRRRRGAIWPALSPSTLAGLIFVLLLLVSGLSLLAYGGFIHPAQLRAQATATVGAVFTADARGTAQARAWATGTAQANARASATMAAQATAIAVATTTAQQNFYNQATSGTPALVDPLSRPSAAGWTVDSNGTEGCSFAGGMLHSMVVTDHFFIPCLAIATNFVNLTLQVHMRLLQGDGGGLVFRSNATSGTGYLFFIDRDGNYSLMLSDGRQANAIIGGPTTAIHTALNQDNLLTVIARGQTITLYINKQFVGSAQDSSFSAGQIGVFAIDLGHKTDAAFSNLQAWVL